MRLTNIERIAQIPNPNLLPTPTEPDDLRLAADCIAFIRVFYEISAENGITADQTKATGRLFALGARIEEVSA